MGGTSTSESGHRWRLLSITLLAYIAVDKLVLTGGGAGNALALFWPSDAAHASFDGGMHVDTGRVLASTSTSSTSTSSASATSGSASASGEHHSHPHEALFMLLFYMMFGTFLLHLTSLPMFKSIQQTVVLFLVGWILALVIVGTGLQGKFIGGRSYNMWIGIDPHLLLYALLPPLLAGDAMTIDIHVAKKVAKQCLYLAGPGVAISATLAALFLYYVIPHEWDFLLCLSTGAILCATDPVAVVALLKELGASPKLTVQIQGESLLNDGTAIVMFNLAYGILGGQTHDFSSIVTYLVKMALYAVLMGAMIGYFFSAWIRAAANKLNHHAALIQVLLTICCAYMSFFVAEAVFHISGVLSTVAASLVLANDMWQNCICHESMHTVWHMLEFLGNTIIFLLAGSLVGAQMANAQFLEFIYLICIYIFLVVLRFAFMFASRPLLKLLHEQREEVTMAEAAVMSWGGLRGAVGLALAIQVNNGRANGNISELDSGRVLFYVGGVALLTLCVNATTCPLLVKKLELTKALDAQIKLLKAIAGQLAQIVNASSHSEPVKQSCMSAVETIQHHVDHMLHLDRKPNQGGNGVTLLAAAALPLKQRLKNMISNNGVEKMRTIDAYHDAVSEFTGLSQAVRDRICEILPNSHLLLKHIAGAEQKMETLRYSQLDADLKRVITQSFLGIVKAEYWHLLEKQQVMTSIGETLVQTVVNSLGAVRLSPTRDFELLKKKLGWYAVQQRNGLAGENMRTSTMPAKANTNVFVRVVSSTIFMVIITVAIIGTSTCVAAEDFIDSSPEWSIGPGLSVTFFVFEIIFNVIFTIELALRLLAEGRSYLLSTTCLFDAVLVILGWVGVSLSAISGISNEVGSQETQTLKSMRIFKALRAFRIFRLRSAFKALTNNLYGERFDVATKDLLTGRMLLLGFVTAHVSAEEKLEDYIGTGDSSAKACAALICLQSLSAVLEAVIVLAQKDKELSEWVLDEVDFCESSIMLSTTLYDFVNLVSEQGVISQTDAHHFLHPIEDHMSRLGDRKSEITRGFATGPQLLQAASMHSFHEEELGLVAAVPREKELSAGVDAKIVGVEESKRSDVVSKLDEGSCAPSVDDRKSGTVKADVIDSQDIPLLEAAAEEAPVAVARKSSSATNEKSRSKSTLSTTNVPTE